MSSSSSKKNLASLPPVDREKRKLQISRDEWHQISDYSRMDIASTLVKVPSADWLEDGLVISPSLTMPGFEGAYQVSSNKIIHILILIIIQIYKYIYHDKT